jgi:hypothetical protein
VWQPGTVPVGEDDAPAPDGGALATSDPESRPADVASVRRSAARFGGRPDDPTFAEGARRFVRRHGWRAYALPVLVIVTVVALISTGGNVKRIAEVASGGGSTGSATTPPVADGNIALKSDEPGADARNTVLKAGALPTGAPYTMQGTGSFSVLKGTGPVVGRGPVHRYVIDVENGITGVDTAEFARVVQSTLSDGRSWSGHGVALQRVDSGSAEMHVSLTSVMTERRLCGYDIPIETSCFAPATGGAANRVVLNVARWVRGNAAYVGDLGAYRTYMVNHETGHGLGHEHAHDCLPGGLAPVMMQQTIGLRSAVSHKLCQANPWPYPPNAAGAPGAEAPDTAQNSEFNLKND